MKTTILKDLEKEDIEKVGVALQKGELVAIPTETVYGLAANGLDENAIQKIYEAKGRPSDNPLILHVSSMEEVEPLVKEITPTAKQLMEAFWPGPLTLTLLKSDSVPDRVTGGLNRVAVRCPSHPVARKVIRAAGVPLAAPSANLSGKPSPTTAEAVYEALAGRLPYIVDGGPCKVGIESTVIEVGTDEVTILRPGAVTASMLEEMGLRVHIDAALCKGSGAPKAPGMKYTHYAPDAPMTTLMGERKQIVRYLLQKLQEEEKKHALEKRRALSFFIHESTAEILQREYSGKIVYRVYTYGDVVGVNDIAHVLYQTLLQMNHEKVSEIYAEGISSGDGVLAIMNRLEKASGGRVIMV